MNIIGEFTLTEVEVKEIIALHIAQKFNVNVQVRDVQIGVHTPCVAGAACYLDATVQVSGDTL